MEHILGKPSAYARRSAAGQWSESQVEFPGAVAIDHVNQRLFTVDSATGGSNDSGQQIMVFDIDPDRIRTGAPVIAVLGQPDAGTKTRGLAANHVGRGVSLAIDDANQRLFATDSANNRVLVFDIRSEGFGTGMDADIVLGQTDFTSNTPGLGPDKLSRPGNPAYDAKNGRLFVVDGGNSRIMVFDARPEVLENGASAIGVMGQPDFTTNDRHEGLNDFATGGLTYDDRNDRLFIAESHSRIEHMRIAVYDVAPGQPLNEAEPTIVLGKPGFDAYDPIVSRTQSVWPRLGAGSIDTERQLLVATEGYPGGNRAMIWDISPENLSTGAPAVEVVGHLDDNMAPDFNRRSANDRVNARNIYPRDVILDPADHRLFAIDQYNNRVMVWQLDSQNRILDREAQWVIGQPHMYTAELRPISANTLKIPIALTYDTLNKRLFVSDGWGNRIMVFDAHPDRLRNGPDAMAVLGQPDFTTTTAATSRTGINLDTRVGTGITPGRPRATALTHDPVNDRLFVSDGGNNRLLVYDTAPENLRNGMAASVVIGQPDFTSNAPGLGPASLRQPAALHYDSQHHRLFVSDGNNNRVLVFDADPPALQNGAEAVAVIGQPDFDSQTAGRSRSAIDGPDGVTYDYANDRLFVSDHGNDRVTIYDFAPEEMRNMPEAVGVIGQQDFESRELGQVRADELWDPRGLTFDSEHQRLYISQGFAANIMIHDMARTAYEFGFPSNSVRSYQSAGADVDSNQYAGYAIASGDDSVWGGAATLSVMRTVFDRESQRESRVLVSETGFGAPPEVDAAMAFVDSRAEATRLHVANRQPDTLRLDFVLRDEQGNSIGSPAVRELGGGESASFQIQELFGRTVSGSVGITGNGDFFLTAARTTANDRNEEIVTAIPVAYGNDGSGQSSLTIPRIQLGGGYDAQIVLLNPGDSQVDGTLRFVTALGEPMAEIGEQGAVQYSIPANGTFVYEAGSTGNTAETGFLTVSAAGGAPVGTAIVRFGKSGALVTETVVGGGSSNETWFAVDTYPSVVRHGRIDHRLTLANGEDEPADVRVIVYDPDGQVLTRTNQIIPPNRQVEFTQVDLADKGRFKGSIRVVSDVPIAATSHRLVRNIRNETIVSNVPSMSSPGGRPDGVVFPGFVDGPRNATQMFVLRKGTGPADGRLEFIDENGEPLVVVLR